MGLAEILEQLPLLDHHAHPLLRWEVACDSPYSAAFTEGYDPQVESHHARHALYFLRSQKDMAELLDCAPSEVEARRLELGQEPLAELCFRAAGVEALLLDDGLMPGQVVDLDWHRRYTPTYRVLRVEWLAESLMGEAKDFQDFRDRFRAGLETEAVAYKSIAAYRSGLEVKETPADEAQAAYRRTRGRIVEKPLIDFLFHETLQVARSNGRPLQIHTGFGDPDLDLRLANPLHLRAAIEAYPKVPFVLLHAGYPFVRETGFLASVYPNAHADFGLTVPFLSVSGMVAVLSELLELTPFTKLLYSSDASRVPDLFYLGALWGRRCLATVLESCLAQGELSANQAERYAAWILAENARGLYRISGPHS